LQNQRGLQGELQVGRRVRAGGKGGFGSHRVKTPNGGRYVNVFFDFDALDAYDSAPFGGQKTPATREYG